MTTHTTEPIGTAFIVYGTVKAIAPDGTERILTPNSPIHAGERLVTGPDGSISVLFPDQDGQLDLGRMSDVLIDEDIFAGVDQGATPDVVAMVEDIQVALLEDEDFDPTVDLPPPAAGGGVAGAGGGGRNIVVFTANQEEVLPDSGAETTGIGYSFLDPPGGIIPEDETVEIAAAPPATPPTVPSFVPPAPPPFDPPEDPPDDPPDDPVEYPIGMAVRSLREANLADGTDPDSTALTVEGTLADLDVDFGSSTTGVLDFGSGSTIVIDGNSGSSISISGDYGDLIIRGDGTWSFTLVDNTLDHSVPGGVEFDDVVNDLFPFAAIYPDGTRVEGGSVLIKVLDDGPSILLDGEITPILVHEDALGNPGFSNDPDADHSTGIIEPGGEDSLGNTFTDIGSIDLSTLVTLQFGADGPGSISYQITGIGPDGVTSGLTSNGVEVFYYIEGEVLVARAGGPEGRDVFTFQVDGNGLATFDLNDQLDHPPASGDDAFLTIDNLGQYVQVSITDGDGDTATATFAGYVQVEVENDVPELVEVDKVPVHYVAENGVFNFPTTVAVALDPFVTPGADEPLSYFWAPIDDDYDTGLSSQGMAVQYAVNEGRDLLNAYTKFMDEDSETIFTVTLNSTTGQAEFELTGTLDHSADDRGVIFLDFGELIQATDADGDYVTMDGLVNIGVIDDPSSDNGEVVMRTSGTGEGEPVAMMAGATTLAFPSDEDQGTPAITDDGKEIDQDEDAVHSEVNSAGTGADSEKETEGQQEGKSEKKDESENNPEERKTDGQEVSEGEEGADSTDDLASGSSDSTDDPDSGSSDGEDLAAIDGGVEENTSLS
ncbi:retention module-containing protein [Desulfobulbus alkaliphilus]|uniref:retention module-containing protein n=1 Tax=Desulfobulbus alkaliphilus TaxID=869814 RepID=UPI001965BF7F|nr:retention module-containing protein [Desulfobulbus alkaliphilus]MBM9538126.1 retention module-containing protein [Desulfobulbus alkaliphilus]